MNYELLIVQYQHGIAVRAEAIALFGVVLVVTERFLVGLHDEVVTSESTRQHQHSAVRQIEIGYHGVCQMEVVRREDEAIRPSMVFLELAVGGDCSLEHPLDCGSDSNNLMSLFVGLVDDVASLLVGMHLLAVHLVLRQILDIYFAEVAEAAVQGHEGEVHALDFHHLHQLRGEMQAGSGSRHGALFLGKDGLEVLCIFGKDIALDDLLRNRCLAKCEEGTLELVVSAVEEETKCTATTRRIVDHLGHHRLVLAEIELVADADLACRIDQNIPQTHVLVQFAKQEDLYLGARLLLVSVEAGREDLCVVEYEDVLLVEVIEHVAKRLVMLDDTLLGVNHHESAVVAERRGLQGDTVFGKLVLELL